MKLPAFLVRNIGLKLLALFLALGIWLVFIPEEKTFSEKTFSVPLELSDLPRDLEIMERPAAAIDVTIRAPKRLLNEVTPSDVNAVLDLSKASIYQTGYPLNKTNVRVPAGVEVVELNPNQVSLTLETAREISLAVQPVVIGRPESGFRQVETSVVPDRVTVRGPGSRIKERDVVKTSPVDISGLVEPAVFEVDLIMPHPDLRVVSGPTRAKVSVVIEALEGSEAPKRKRRP